MSLGKVAWILPDRFTEQMMDSFGPLLGLALGAMKIAGYYVCFGYMILRRANPVAAWLFLAMSVLRLALNALDLDSIVAQKSGYVVLIFGLLATELAAAAMLFRPQARAWLHRRGRLPDYARTFG